MPVKMGVLLKTQGASVLARNVQRHKVFSDGLSVPVEYDFPFSEQKVWARVRFSTTRKAAIYYATIPTIHTWPHYSRSELTEKQGKEIILLETATW